LPLCKKVTKKIKPANKKAEILNISLKSIRRGGGKVFYCNGNTGSDSLDFFTADYSNF